MDGERVRTSDPVKRRSAPDLDATQFCKNAAGPQGREQEVWAERATMLRRAHPAAEAAGSAFPAKTVKMPFILSNLDMRRRSRVALVRNRAARILKIRR